MEKKLNKTIKIDAVLPTVEAGSNGLSEAQNCVCQTWAMLTAQQAIEKIVPEEQFQKALREKKIINVIEKHSWGNDDRTVRVLKELRTLTLRGFLTK